MSTTETATLPTPKSSSFKDALGAAKLPERIVALCFRGDLVAEIQNLEVELRTELENEATQTTDQRLGSSKKSRPLAEKIEKKRAEMREASVDLRLRALPASQWRELKRQHPTQENDDESLTRFIVATLPDSIIEPEDARDDAQALADALTEGQWDEIVRAVIELNEEGVSVPFSRIASVAMQQSDDA